MVKLPRKQPLWFHRRFPCLRVETESVISDDAQGSQTLIDDDDSDWLALFEEVSIKN